MPALITEDPFAFTLHAYDFVIVGGGTAGLALATRLSENPKFSIGVIEAGPDRTKEPEITTASSWAKAAFNPTYNWLFKNKERVLEDGRKVFIDVIRGKLLGGSSAMNGMAWTQASKSEYDAIAALGNPGWSFEDLVPYFKKAQSHTPQHNDILGGKDTLTAKQGTDGPIRTSFSKWYSSLISPYAQALSALSININSDPSGGDVSGLSNTARCIDPATKTRRFAAAYLDLAAERSNIFVLVGAQATKVVFSQDDPTTATAVKFIYGQEEHEVKALKEVVLSAGVYKTPQLLELSGIGDKSILEEHGVTPNSSIGNHPGVGANLQDHLGIFAFLGITAEASTTLSFIPSAPDVTLAPGEDFASVVAGNPYTFTTLHKISSPEDHSKLAAMLKSYQDAAGVSALEHAQFDIQRQRLDDPNNTACDVEIMFSKTMPYENGQLKLWLIGAHLHPASRGTVHIGTRNPLDAPNIDHKYLDKEYDLQALTHIVRFIHKISKTEPLGSLLSGMLDPPPAMLETDEKIEEYVKARYATLYHPIGSAAMAPKDMGGVVDPQLKVYGTKNLRIVDASIIPLQLGTHTMATVYAIAEKAADIIKGAYGEGV